MIPHIDVHLYEGGVLMPEDVANCRSEGGEGVAVKLTEFSHGSG